MKLTMMPATTAIVLICVLTTLVGIWPGFLENMLAVGAFIPARLYMGEGELGALVNSLPVVVTPFTSVD